MDNYDINITEDAPDFTVEEMDEYQKNLDAQFEELITRILNMTPEEFIAYCESQS